MITCTLSDKQLSILRTKIARDLLTYIDTKTPFNLRDYLLKMYTTVKGATNNENSAIDYARLTAPFIKQLLGVDTTYDDVRSLGLDIIELYDLTKNISDDKNGINNLIDYLDLNSNKSKQLKGVKTELQIEENQKESEKKNQVRVSNTVYGVTGKPATPISTTIQELIDGQRVKGKDPNMAVYTAVTKKILTLLFNSNTINEGADVTGQVVPVPFEGVTGGLVLTLTRYNTINKDDVYPYVKDVLDSGVDKNFIIEDYNKGYVYILTDVNGNAVRFNEDSEVDANGRIIYFNSRYLPKRLDNDQFDVDNVTNVRTPLELSQNFGISIDEAREELRAEFEQLEKSYQYIDSKPGNTVVYNITGGSYGSQDTAGIEPISFRPDIFKSETPVFAYLKENQAGDGRYAGIYIQNPVTKSYYLTLNSSLAGKVDELVKFLTEDIVHPDGDVVSAKEKVAVLSTYVLNSIKDIHYKVNTETDQIEISLSGQLLNLSTSSGKSQLREALLKTTAGYDRTYVVNTTKANKNSSVAVFSLSGNTAEISTVPYQKYLETFLKVIINLDSEGNPVTYNPYFTLSLANTSSAKILLAPENIDQKSIEGPVFDKKADIERRSGESSTDFINRLFKNNYFVEVDGKQLFSLAGGRWGVIVNVNGITIPFYQSTSGTDTKITGQWYPFFGDLGNWVIKGNSDDSNLGYGFKAIQDVQSFLNANIKETDAFALSDIVPTEINQNKEDFRKLNESQIKSNNNLSISKKATAKRLSELMGYTVEEANKTKSDAELFALASKKVFAELAALQGTTTTTRTENKPEEFVNHSGGAYGGDTFWDLIGRLYGVTDHRHYKEKGEKTSQTLANREVTVTPLSDEQMKFAEEQLNTLFGPDFLKRWTKKKERDLQIRNYYQVANADSVFAVAELNKDRNGVKGGTNTAVQLGI